MKPARQRKVFLDNLAPAKNEKTEQTSERETIDYNDLMARLESEINIYSKKDVS